MCQNNQSGAKWGQQNFYTFLLTFYRNVVIFNRNRVSEPEDRGPTPPFISLYLYHPYTPIQRTSLAALGNKPNLSFMGH